MTTRRSTSDTPVRENVGVADTAHALMTRGQGSWAYIYVLLGFALGLEASILALVEPLSWPRSVIAFLGVAAATIYLFLFSGWFQNKLISWKSSYEDRPRNMNLGSTILYLSAIVTFTGIAWWWAPEAVQSCSR